MDQFSNNNESAPFKLPEVQAEPEEAKQSYEASSNDVSEKSMAKSIEQNTNANPLNRPSPLQAKPYTLDPKNLDDPSTMVPANGTTKQITVTDGLPANDLDLIEKAWVVKAKAIVEQTKNDPHEQSDELNKIRNDYQSKRFNTKLTLDKE